MKTDNATPRPWRLKINESSFAILSYARKSTEKQGINGMHEIARIERRSYDPVDALESESNAKLIVRAVNNFDSLLGWVKYFVSQLERSQEWSGSMSKALLKQAAEAIQKAEG